MCKRNTLQKVIQNISSKICGTTFYNALLLTHLAFWQYRHSPTQPATLLHRSSPPFLIDRYTRSQPFIVRHLQAVSVKVRLPPLTIVRTPVFTRQCPTPSVADVRHLPSSSDALCVLSIISRHLSFILRHHTVNHHSGHFIRLTDDQHTLFYYERKKIL